MEDFKPIDGISCENEINKGKRAVAVCAFMSQYMLGIIGLGKKR